MSAIEIVEPDAEWPAQFTAVARLLRAALGDRAVRIDHIGSTAVAGLPAKPIVDVQVTVREFDGLRDPLEAAGRRGGAGHETVLIDWESVGPGPMGADLASLLFSSARRGDISAGWLPELLPAALVAYQEGIADVGGSADADDVALGLHASIALRWTLVRDVVRAMRGPGGVFRGSAPHETPEEAIDELVALIPVLLDSATEARGLMAAR